MSPAIIPPATPPLQTSPQTLPQHEDPSHWSREGRLRYRVPQKHVHQEAVLRTEFPFRTPEACFLHRVSLKTHRVHQEAFLSTECIFRTPEAPSPVPNATNTTQSHPAAQTTASSTPSLQPCPHYGHPPHGNRLGQEPTALRKNLCNFFKKLLELSRSFFIFVPNKHRNTQCKLFTTNTTNSWNLPR